MRHFLRSLTAFIQEFSYGVHAAHAIRHGQPLSPGATQATAWPRRIVSSPLEAPAAPEPLALQSGPTPEPHPRGATWQPE